jgi:hypothetical protein
MLAPLGLAPPGIAPAEFAPPELAPPELMVVQTILLYAPPEPEVCRHLRRHREFARDDLRGGCGETCPICNHHHQAVSPYASCIWIICAHKPDVHHVL